MFVIPGDAITPQNALKSGENRIICGRGIIEDNNQLYASVAGFVNENHEKVWVNSFYRRYLPQTDDKVIGIVTHKLGDFWRVDIGGIEKAEIEFTNFENATKRNRPDVKVGDLLYGIVTVHNKHLEPVMSCVDSLGKARGMGLLPREGIIFSVSCSYSRRLLTRGCKILPIIEQSFGVEITVGVNGRIWLKGTYDDIKFLKAFIIRCEKIPESEAETVMKDMMVASRGEPSLQEALEVKMEVKDEIEDDDPMNTV